MLRSFQLLLLLFVVSLAATAQTLTTTDSALNTGAAISTSYTAPGTNGANGVVTLSTNSSENLWLMYNNPWGITSGSGTMTQSYTGKGAMVTAINLTGVPTGGVVAYPFVLYGCDPWMDCYQNQPPQFPAKLTNLTALNVDIAYSLTGTITGGDTDLLFDEWVCNSAKPSDSSQCLEVEVLPYYSFVDFGGGTFVETLIEPALVNGASSTYSFDEYNGGGDVLFYPHTIPGMSSGELSFNLLDLLNAAVSLKGYSSYQYVAGIELGTEFGASTTQNYTLAFTKVGISQTLGTPSIVTPTLHWSAASLTYPNPLTASQLNAKVSSVATNIAADGTFTYYVGPVSNNVIATVGTVVPAGTGQLCVVWKPTSAYSSTYASVSGCVNMTWKIAFSSL